MKSIRAMLVSLFVLMTCLTLVRPCAADPSMDMQGGGGAGTQSCTCPTTGCTGVLTASLSGPPLGKVDKAELTLKLVTHNSVSSNGGCVPATGTGDFNKGAYSVTFSGQVCDDFTNSLFSVNGALQFIIHPERAGDGEGGSGNLSAIGAIHLPCFPFGKNPFQTSVIGMVVGIIGVAGQIPLLTP